MEEEGNGERRDDRFPIKGADLEQTLLYIQHFERVEKNQKNGLELHRLAEPMEIENRPM